MSATALLSFSKGLQSKGPIGAPPHLAKDPWGSGYLRRFQEASEQGPGVPPLCLSPPKPLSLVSWSCLWSSGLWPSMTAWPLLPSSPFDTESFLVSPSAPGKFSTGSRRGSLYTWTPPNTPSFRERYYLVSEPRWAAMRWGRGRLPRAQHVASVCTFRGSKLGVHPPCLGVFWGTFSFSLPALCSVASGFGSGLDWGGVLQMVLPPWPRPWLPVCFALWNVFPVGNSWTSCAVRHLFPVTSRGLGPLLSAPLFSPSSMVLQRGSGPSGSRCILSSLCPLAAVALVMPWRPSLTCWHRAAPRIWLKTTLYLTRY